jgi:hypothetical protein
MQTPAQREARMIISVRGGKQVTLDDHHNFRAFKVVVEQPQATLGDAQVALHGIAMLPDRDTAWVSADALRNWPTVKDDADWQQAFDAMIEKAKPHGWIDEAHGTIKAHVEWHA